MSDFFSWDLIDLSRIRNKSGEQIATCPRCIHTRTKAKNKNARDLGVNMDTGIAHCCHCGAKSKRDFKEKAYTPKAYVLPKWENSTKISDEVVKWFECRGIYQKTLIKNNITEDVVWFPAVQSKLKGITYPYFVDDTVLYIKYRSKNKDWASSKDSKKVLYGLNHLKLETEAWFVEGENDKLAMYEAGIKNVVSCPSGTQLSLTEKAEFLETGEFNDDNVLNLEYIDNSFEQIKHIKKWKIFTDDDPPGKKLKRELIRRFGAENCEVVADYEGCNDSNEFLIEKGKIALAKIKTIPVPLDGVFSIHDEWDYILDIKENGYKTGKGIDIPSYDKHYKYRLGEIEAFTGHPNLGKTTVMIWEKVLTAVMFGWKYAIYSPENYPAGEFYISLIECYLGKDIGYSSNDEMLRARDFIADHFFVIDWDDEDALVTPDMVIEKTKELIKRKGVNGLLIDPWNDLYHKLDKGENKEDYLLRVLSKMRRFKRKYNIRLIINAHPTSESQRRIEDHPEQGKRQAVAHYRDISGGSAFGNRIDNGRAVHRNIGDELYFKTTELHIQKVKFQKLVGIPTMDSPILMEFKNNRFLIDGIDPIEKFLSKKRWDDKQKSEGKQVKAFSSKHKIDNDYDFTDQIEIKDNDDVPF